MKKTLFALALAGAFAGSAMAAEVTMYGLVDLGVQYTHTDDGVNDTTDTFEMKSGTNSGSRFGLKGEEDLGNGLRAGFVLENGFDADTGELGQNDRLFGREASLYLAGNFGTFRMGRLTQLTSSTGTTGLFGSAVSPFSTGWGGVRGHKAVMAGGFTQLDNAVVYTTPDFAGFKVHAQYSFDMDSKDGGDDHGVEGESSVDRYAALGVTYQNGPLNLVAIVDQYNYASFGAQGTANADEGYTFNVGGAYDFGPAKLFVAAQYFDDMQSINTGVLTADDTNFKGLGVAEGYGMQLGLSAPVWGGSAKFAVGYLDAESVDNSDNDLQRYTVSAGYEYPLSKRTFVYAGAGYMQDQYGAANVDDASSVAVVSGLVHKF